MNSTTKHIEINWATIPSKIVFSPSDECVIKTKRHGKNLLQKIDYAPGYEANHWCAVAHFIECLKGFGTLVFDDGEIIELKKGDSCKIKPDGRKHKLMTRNGITLIIVE